MNEKWWSDLIGFALVALIFILPLLLRFFQEKKPPAKIEPSTHEEEDPAPSFLPPPHHHEPFSSSIETRKLKLKVGPQKEKRGKQAIFHSKLQRKNGLQTMVILAEIYGRPRSDDE